MDQSKTIVEDFETTRCSSRGEWAAVWDRCERNPAQEQGWRVAWIYNGKHFVWDDITFGRKQDAERAVEAMYSLNEWNCGDQIECRQVALSVSVKTIRQTIMEWLAW